MAITLNISRPVRCEKCGEKFTRTHGRQKFCITCIPNWRRTRAAVRQAERLDAATVKLAAKPADEPFTYEDLCRLWGRRTTDLMRWMAKHPDSRVTEYRGYRKMTAHPWCCVSQNRAAGFKDGEPVLRAYGKSGFADSVTSPSWTDKAGQPYGCCHEWGICPQHAEQRKQDLRELGFWLTARRVADGVFRHFAIE